jgi:D-tyrosyl-tRNA(Tyr) deacylase
MKCVIQRVTRASVSVEQQPPDGFVGPGLVVLAGFEASDAEQDADWMAEKVVGLRIFPDEQGKMNLDVIEAISRASASAGASVGGVVLVPNFTLAGEASRGRRPSFDRAMPPDEASRLFDRFCERVESRVVGAGQAGEMGRSGQVARGVFRTHMLVELANDGPVTIIMDSRDRPR